MPVDPGTLPRVDPRQFGAVGGRDRRADQTVALSYTDADKQGVEGMATKKAKEQAPQEAPKHQAEAATTKEAKPQAPREAKAAPKAIKKAGHQPVEQRLQGRVFIPGWGAESDDSSSMRGIHDGKLTGHPIVHMHILHISKEEVSHTKEGEQPSRRVKVTPRMSKWHRSPK